MLRHKFAAVAGDNPPSVMKGEKKMFSMVFNTTNLLILIIVLIICYSFWAPYIRGKKIKAVVDGYCHPAEGKNCDVVWCYRLMYREQKAGKRLYCCTRQTYDTREEMRAKYPKGTEVNIRCFTSPNTQEPIAVILDDNDVYIGCFPWRSRTCCRLSASDVSVGTIEQYKGCCFTEFYQQNSSLFVS